MEKGRHNYKIKLNPTEAKYQDKNRYWQGIPGVAKAGNGRLWATWYSGGTTEGAGNWIVLYTSADDVDSWEGPVFVIDSENDLRAVDPNLWVDPDGRMWFFWQQGDRVGDCVFSVYGMYTENPGDRELIWSQPKRIANGVAINDPTVLRDGTWVLPTTVWSIHMNDVLGDENNAGCYISKDKGETWTYQGSVNKLTGTRDHEENMIVEQMDGSWRMLMRSRIGIEESFSYDGGVTWSDGVDAGLTRTPSRFHFKRLASGNILLVYHNSPTYDASRTYLTAALSTDDGKTWSHKLLLDRRFEVSYPDVQEDADGNIYIIYDCCRWSSMEILLAKITEEDIKVGELVTATSYLRKLVNNNGGLEVQQADFECSEGAWVTLKEQAKFEWTRGTMKMIQVGSKLFVDDEHVFNEKMPEALKGKNYLYTETNNTGNTLKVTSDGYLYILTYVDADTPIQLLRDQGFRTQITIPHRQVCASYPWPNAFMEKRVTVGEEIELCNWSIVIA